MIYVVLPRDRIGEVMRGELTQLPVIDAAPVGARVAIKVAWNRRPTCIVEVTACDPDDEGHTLTVRTIPLDHEPRLLAADSSRGYTRDPRLALQHEPEAVDEHYQDHILMRAMHRDAKRRRENSLAARRDRALLTVIERIDLAKRAARAEPHRHRHRPAPVEPGAAGTPVGARDRAPARGHRTPRIPGRRMSQIRVGQKYLEAGVDREPSVVRLQVTSVQPLLVKRERWKGFDSHEPFAYAEDALRTLPLVYDPELRPQELERALVGRRIVQVSVHQDTQDFSQGDGDVTLVLDDGRTVDFRSWGYDAWGSCSVLVHEYGHLAGRAHTTDRRDVM